MASSVEYHNCSKCPYKTRSKITMKNHSKAHNLSHRAIFDCASPIEPLKCYQCANFKTHNLAELKRHFKAGHALLEPDEEKLYDCESCIFRTFSRYLYLRHKLYNMCMTSRKVESEEAIPEEMKESETGDENFQCTYCSFELHSRRSMEEHVKVFHESGRRSYYTAKNNLDYKRRIKHTENTRCQKFDHCSYVIKCRCSPKTHDRTDPERIQWFDCDYCSYRGKTSARLKRHVALQHNSKKLLKCEHCPFETKFKRSLEIHINIRHTEAEKIQWFQCAQCPYKSKSKCTWYNHIRFKHGNEFLKCERCSFQTKYKRNLEKHFRSQHMELEKIPCFNCEHCSCKFKTRALLKRHVSAQHIVPARKNVILILNLEWNSDYNFGLDLNKTGSSLLR